VNTTVVRIVVTDSNVLINLMHVSRVDFCGRIPGHEFVVPDHVREEINDPDQRLTLDAALNAGTLRLVFHRHKEVSRLSSDRAVAPGAAEASRKLRIVVNQMLSSSNCTAGRWVTLAALALCCACGSSTTLPAASGGTHYDAGSVEGGQWPDAGCTFGQNQTCNDDPAMSAYAGNCSKSGTCSCMPGFAIRLATGKCAAYMPKSGDPCQRNGGCNDNPTSSTVAGVCLNDGSCYCLGSAVENPDTGLCKTQ